METGPAAPPVRAALRSREPGASTSRAAVDEANKQVLLRNILSNLGFKGSPSGYSSGAETGHAAPPCAALRSREPGASTAYRAAVDEADKQVRFLEVSHTCDV